MILSQVRRVKAKPAYARSRSSNLIVWVLALFCAWPLSAADESQRFKEVEIRVIRPRYFTKTGKLELGGALNTVMNESFIYTFLFTGLMTYHINEEWAIEASGGLGYSIDREDKRILFDQFDIKTQIFRTAYMGTLGVQWTPVYGKWQLPSGKLVYFDTYLQVGAGKTGVEWRYSDFCEEINPVLDPNGEAIPKNKTSGYSSFMAGIGQRYFVSRKMAYKWDIRENRYFYNLLDGECSPTKARTQQGISGTNPHDSITLMLGVAYYL